MTTVLLKNTISYIPVLPILYWLVRFPERPLQVPNVGRLEATVATLALHLAAPPVRCILE